jgi:4-diphosphocytidyl-2-C-methyl-D-erythritol kinase
VPPDVRSLSIRAFAKVNLDLRVLRRRHDGYHELRTIFQTVTLHDTLSFRSTRAPFELRASGEAIPLDSRNIIWKAARSIWSAMDRGGEPRGVSVHVIKRVPVQAGLGGGSSNGAATLLALNRLWRVKLPSRRLFELAESLGSDVPFFLLGGTALAVGRGEVLYPLSDLPSMHVVVARHVRGVSSAEAYGWLDGSSDEAPECQSLPVPWPPGTISVRNDFEPAVFPRVPEAASLRQTLIDQGAQVAMLCGSGSAVYAVFSREGAAWQAATQVRRIGASVWLTEFRGRRSSRWSRADV